MNDLSSMEDGIYTDITDDEYFGDKSRVNCSTLKKVIMNGGSTKYLQQETVITEAIRIGKAFHTLVLEPEKFDERFIALGEDYNFTTKEGRAVKDRYSDCVFTSEKGSKSDGDKKIVLKRDQYEELENLRNGLLIGADKRETLAAELLRQQGLCECVVLFHYMNIPCKIKIDKLLTVEYHALDVKTCASCKKEDFTKHVFDYGYFLQAAFYKLAFRCLDSTANIKFSFLAVEKVENVYLSQVYNTDPWDGKAQMLIDHYLPITYEAMQKKEYNSYTFHDQQKNLTIPLDGWIEKKIDKMLYDN